MLFFFTYCMAIALITHTSVRKAVLSMMAVRKMSMMTSESKLSPSAQELATNINKYMQDSEREQIDGDRSVMHHHNADEEAKDGELKRTDDIAVAPNGDGDGDRLGVSENGAGNQKMLSPTDANAPDVVQLKTSSLEAQPESGK